MHITLRRVRVFSHRRIFSKALWGQKRREDEETGGEGGTAAEGETESRLEEGGERKKGEEESPREKVGVESWAS